MADLRLCEFALTLKVSIWSSLHYYIYTGIIVWLWILSGPLGMAAITAGVCVCVPLSAGSLPFLLWLPGGEGEKAEHVSTSALRWTDCLGLPPLVTWYGVRRKSLDFSGRVAAILVGFVLTVGSACFCVSLLVFFFTFLPADSVEGEGEGEV